MDTDLLSHPSLPSVVKMAATWLAPIRQFTGNQLEAHKFDNYRIGSRKGSCTLQMYTQGLRASSLQFTSPLEFNAIFRDGFTLRHELTAGSKIRDHVPAKFKHVTNIVTCTLLCCDYVTYVLALNFPKSWLRILGYRQKIPHFFFSHKWIILTLSQ